jgi:hypothetical protein
MAMNVRVLTGTDIVIAGPQYQSYFQSAAAAAGSDNPGSVTLTPRVSSCWMYGAVNRNDAAVAWTPITSSGTIFDQNIADSTNNASYGTFWSSGPLPTVAAPVQSGYSNSTSLTTLTVTFGSATTAGNTVVVCIGTHGGTASPVVAGVTLGGSAGNFTFATRDNGPVMNTEIWYDPVCAGGQTSIVISFTGGSGSTPFVYAATYEVTGALTLDQATAGSGTGTSWSSGTTAPTSTASEIFFGAATVGTVPTVTGAGTWVNQTGAFFAAGYQVVSAEGTAAYTGTASPADYTVAVATFYTSGSNSFTAGTPATIGASNGDSGGGVYGGAVCAEIPPMPAGGPVAEDPSAPPLVSTTSATSVTTARFTPPMGSLLVAMIAAAGGTGVTMTDDNGMLTWVQLAAWASGTSGYAGVWAAVVVCG